MSRPLIRDNTYLHACATVPSRSASKQTDGSSVPRRGFGLGTPPQGSTQRILMSNPVSQPAALRCHRTPVTLFGVTGYCSLDGYWGALHPLTNLRYTLRAGADKRVTIRSLLDCSTIIRSISCNSAVNSVCLSKDGRCACMSQCICVCVIASLCRAGQSRHVLFTLQKKHETVV